MVRKLQAGNVGEAQVLLDATECTCPNGMLWRGIFDHRGEWYKVPEWIVIEPEGLVDEEDLKDEAGSVGDDEDKEVEVDDLGEEVKVKCRLSTGHDCVLEVRKGERVASIITKLKTKTGVSSRPRIAAQTDRSNRCIPTPASVSCTVANPLMKANRWKPILTGITTLST